MEEDSNVFEDLCSCTAVKKIVEKFVVMLHDRVVKMLGGGQSLFHTIKNFAVVDPVQIRRVQCDNTAFFVESKLV